ncbi:MAG: phosphatidate cytidylyltransferase [Proteobacteria bacterium]|nr:phosphatidate cytidylyltransferase [Pseudomonadota bacterium]
MLKTRILTVVILLPFLMWLLLYAPHEVMFVALAISTTISVFEMSMMLQPRLDELFRNFVFVDNTSAVPERKNVYHAASRPKHYVYLASFCSIVMTTIFAMSVYSDLVAGRGTIVLGLMLALLAAVFATRGIEAEMARVLGFVLTLVYAGFPWLVIWDLYIQEPASRQVLLVLIVVWCGDTGGYFGGRFWGKHKLAPNKSPKKTWEGAITGLSASIAGAIAFHLFYYVELAGGVVTAVLAGLFGGITGQMGDLVESVFKRFTRVKDSGAILPGHGGLLDRIDGVLFAAPVIWFILYWAKVFN